MERPLTLFTGQWADLPLAELATRAAAWGYDALELACWGDHFDVAAAIADRDYGRSRRELLERQGLRCFALGAHLVGQAKRRLDGRRSILASHLPFGDRARGWDFVSPGRGDVDFDELFRTLNEIGYVGPLSVEWEDSGMDRDRGAAESLAFVRQTELAPSGVAFDDAMQQHGRP